MRKHPILEIFTNRNFTNVGPRKQAITIRHLLKTQMGIEWSLSAIGEVDHHDYPLLSNISADRMENLPWDVIGDEPGPMLNSDDLVQYILDKPMVNNPGTQFVYNSGASHLLSVILWNKTGMNTVDFADKYLFKPLNITNYHWWNDSMGITLGCYGLWLQPTDMAKIGYLYLNNGSWDETPIVPEQWVEISTTGDEVTHEYSYQWWIGKENTYWAYGLGGQYIIVIPDKSLVVVITASAFSSTTSPRSIVLNFLKAAMKADELTTTSEPKTSSSNVNENTSNQLSLLGVLSFSLSTIHYRKNKKK